MSININLWLERQHGRVTVDALRSFIYAVRKDERRRVLQEVITVAEQNHRPDPWAKVMLAELEERDYRDSD